MSIERRFVSFRKSAVQGRTLTGYAAVFNSPSSPLASKKLGFIEILKPGCFARALAQNQDVRALVNHNPDLIVGRTASGTLKLAEDSVGLRFDLDVAPTSAGNDLLALVNRQDLSQCSFSFVAKGQQWDKSKAVPVRSITDCDLLDISVVTYPVYDATAVQTNDMADGDPFPMFPMDDDDDDEDNCFMRALPRLFPHGLGEQAELRSVINNVMRKNAWRNELKQDSKQLNRRRLMETILS
jgi:uncharacterized protein